MRRKYLMQFKKKIGKTQGEMTKIWGITLCFYKKIEGGTKNPSISRVKEFKKAFSKTNIEKIFLSQ